MLSRDQLTAAVRRLLDSSTVELVDWEVQPARSSTGRATAWVAHVSGRARVPGRTEPQTWRLVLKVLRESDGDDEQVAPHHWTYCRREALAYQSGILASDDRQGLCAVPCLGVFGNVIALAERPADRSPRWELEHYVAAARHLRRWHAEVHHPRPWLAADQLAQRIARTDAAGGLDLAGVPDRLCGAWQRRWTVLEELEAIPTVLSHGDFSRGNLSFGPEGQLFVIDWATLGLSPPGFDLAHLTLSAMVDPYLNVAPATVADALLDAYGPAPGFFGSILLTGISRLCWTRQRTRDPEVLRGWQRISDWLEDTGA